MRVIRKKRAQPLDDQLLGCPVSFRNQIEIALQLEGDVPLKIVLEERSGLMRDLDRAFDKGCHRTSGNLVQVLDVVFEDEEIRNVRAGDADETLIVIFDGSAHFFAIDQLHAHGNLRFDQTLQVLDLFKGLLRRARMLGFGIRHVSWGSSSAFSKAAARAACVCAPNR